MKYIDADKLLAEIARLRKEHTTREYRDEAALVLEDLEDYIDSLQEEQVEKKTFDDYLKASPAERRKMNMTEILGAEKLAKVKEMMEQEQTEVDLEQEVISYFQGMWPGIDANTTMSFTPPAIMRLVKHFYGLGKEHCWGYKFNEPCPWPAEWSEEEKKAMKEKILKIITKDDNLEEAGAQYVKTYFRDIDWNPDVIKLCLEEAFISGGEYVFKQIKDE